MKKGTLALLALLTLVNAGCGTAHSVLIHLNEVLQATAAVNELTGIISGDA